MQGCARDNVSQDRRRKRTASCSFVTDSFSCEHCCAASRAYVDEKLEVHRTRPVPRFYFVFSSTAGTNITLGLLVVTCTHRTGSRECPTCAMAILSSSQRKSRLPACHDVCEACASAANEAQTSNKDLANRGSAEPKWRRLVPGLCTLVVSRESRFLYVGSKVGFSAWSRTLSYMFESLRSDGPGMTAVISGTGTKRLAVEQ